MPAIAILFLKYATNYRVILGVFIAMFVAWAVLTHYDNIKVHKELAVATQSMTDLKEAQNTMEDDISNIDIASKKTTIVRTKQTNVEKQIAAIPNSSKDKPFSDINLLNASHVMRDYQTNALGDSTP